MAQPWNSLHWLLQNYKVSKAYCIVSQSGEFSDRQAQSKVAKIKKILFFPTGLEVHLEDMF